MAKGALPVPYIVAIVIAIIVIIVLIYWFYTSYISTDIEGKKKFCEAQRTIYCTAWKVSNYNTDDKGNPATPPGAWDKFAPNCVTSGMMSSVGREDCRRIIGEVQTTPGTTS